MIGIPIYLIIGVVVLIGLFVAVQNRADREIESRDALSDSVYTKSHKSAKMSHTSISNRVVNVTLTGGLIGLFGVSPQRTLNKRIAKENAAGWYVVQVIPASSGNIMLWILRILLLAITLLLYTTSNGYYLVLARQEISTNDEHPETLAS